MSQYPTNFLAGNETLLGFHSSEGWHRLELPCPVVSSHDLAEGRAKGAHSPGSLPGMLWEGLTHGQQQCVPSMEPWLPAPATLLHRVPMWDWQEKGLSRQ